MSKQEKRLQNSLIQLRNKKNVNTKRMTIKTNKLKSIVHTLNLKSSSQSHLRKGPSILSISFKQASKVHERF